MEYTNGVEHFDGRSGIFEFDLVDQYAIQGRAETVGWIHHLDLDDFILIIPSTSQIMQISQGV